MSETHIFKVVPEEKDWIAANWLIVRHRWLWWRLVLAFLVIWLFYGALIVGFSTLDYGWNSYWALRNFATSAAYAAIVMAIVVALTLVLLPRRVRKRMVDFQRLTDGMEITCTPDHVSSKSDVGQVTLGWGQLKRWHENDKVLALMITDNEMLVLPKSQVAPEVLADVRRYLAAANLERA